MAKRQSVFISYAHKDGTEFTKRLAFALEMYMDVFWDKRLQSGEYPKQLEHQIETKDHFILVMSPYSLRAEGWCERELKHAIKHNRNICLAKIYPYNDEDAIYKELAEKYPIGMFIDDFETGFREVTGYILGNRYSSWEMAARVPPSELLKALKNGYIPAIICKQFIIWLAIEMLWYILDLNSRKQGYLVANFGQPYTIYGMIAMCRNLMDLAKKDNNISFAGTLETDLLPTLENIYTKVVNSKDNEHVSLGNLANDFLEYTKKFVKGHYLSGLDFKTAFYFNQFEFTVHDKLRGLIDYYANTARRLY